MVYFFTMGIFFACVNIISGDILIYIRTMENKFGLIKTFIEKVGNTLMRL